MSGGTRSEYAREVLTSALEALNAAAHRSSADARGDKFWLGHIHGLVAVAQALLDPSDDAAAEAARPGTIAKVAAE